MSRLAWTWTLFGLVLAVAIVPMAWMTQRSLEAERARREMAEQAAAEEAIRLALWRMDSEMGPLFLRESSRPYFVYRSFYAAPRAYSNSNEILESDSVRLPSPLLASPPKFVRLHFDVDLRGNWSSPRVLEEDLRGLAGQNGIFAEEIEDADRDLAELQSRVTVEWLDASLPRLEADELVQQDAQSQRWAPFLLDNFPSSSAPAPSRPPTRAAPPPEWQAQQRLKQSARSSVESISRRLYANRVNDVTNLVASQLVPGPRRDAIEGPLHGLWIEDDLLLVRRVSVAGAEWFQGCWVDWPSLSANLLARVVDLVPEARLEPVDPLAADRLDRQLMAVPAVLVPGEIPTDPDAPSLSTGPSLAAAWGCFALAAIACAVLLKAVLALSERRAAFVSAVTHELRTPLTTLRMYSEMLARGMVRDPAKKQQYVEKMQTESDRLAQLVENVLSYARLERGTHPRGIEIHSLASLVERVAERLRDRAAEADLELELDLGADDVRVWADAVGVEQILFNLVDNAAKYARASEDPRIHIEIAAGGVRVRDHGPGIATAVRSRLFRPFTEADRDRTSTAAGVGLGLSLCRKIARSLGGDLVLEDTAEGTSFFLRLKRARAS